MESKMREVAVKIQPSILLKMPIVNTLLLKTKNYKILIKVIIIRWVLFPYSRPSNGSKRIWYLRETGILRFKHPVSDKHSQCDKRSPEKRSS